MIVKFDEHDYIDMEKVVALRKSPKGVGVIIFEGERILVGATAYKIIESMYLWLHNNHIYGVDKKPLKTVVVKEGDK